MRINSQIMKKNNVMLIVRTVQQCAPISRTELTARVGLTTTSVINLTNALVEAGILVEVGRASSAPQGRKAVVFGVRPEALYTVGLELNTDGIRVGICDFQGRFVAWEQRSISPQAGVDVILDAITTLVRHTVQQAGIPWEKLLGLGLALPGPLDSRRGVMINPPNFPFWDNVPICEILRSRLGLPVCCDREANAAALAEHFYGAAIGYKTAFVMALFRLGVGGSLISGGNVLHGYRDGAGEIGHTTVDPSGPRCTCGGRGCLELMVSGEAIRRQVRGGADGPEGEELTLEELFRRSEAGDERCAQAVRQAADYISAALGSVINLYSPEAIVLAGPLPAMSSQLVALIRERIQAKRYPRHCAEIQVVESGFGERSFVMGGVVLAMNEFLPDRISENLSAPARRSDS